MHGFVQRLKLPKTKLFQQIFFIEARSESYEIKLFLNGEIALLKSFLNGVKKVKKCNLIGSIIYLFQKCIHHFECMDLHLSGQK